MVKNFLVDDIIHDKFRDAVSKAHGGNPHGYIAREHRKALENHIKLLEAKNK